jgi:hypothetical protein
MAEINNSLALQIQQPDIGKTLLTAGQINEMRAKTALEEASTQNTQASTAEKNAGLRGQAASIIWQNPTPDGVEESIKHFHNNGTPLDSLTQESMRKMARDNPQALKQRAADIMHGGMSAQTNTQLNTHQIYKRQQAETSGGLQGQLTAPNGSGPPSPPGQPSPPATPAPPLIQQVETAKNRAAQGVTNLDKYNKEGTSASIQSAALHQMQVDANQVRLGAGATSQEAARKVVTAIGEMVPSLKPFTDSMADKSAAFQSFDKNAGIVSRAITQEVGTQAASGLDMITKSLISSGNTNKGVDLIAPQLIGLSHFKQARASASNKWSDEHGGDMTGFETDFNKKASVGAWMVKELPPDQQQIVGQYLKKNNPDAFKVMIKQLNNIREQKLDEGVF